MILPVKSILLVAALTTFHIKGYLVPLPIIIRHQISMTNHAIHDYLCSFECSYFSLIRPSIKTLPFIDHSGQPLYIHVFRNRGPGGPIFTLLVQMHCFSIFLFLILAFLLVYLLCIDVFIFPLLIIYFLFTYSKNSIVIRLVFFPQEI